MYDDRSVAKTLGACACACTHSMSPNAIPSSMLDSPLAVVRSHCLRPVSLHGIATEKVPSARISNAAVAEAHREGESRPRASTNGLPLAVLFLGGLANGPSSLDCKSLFSQGGSNERWASCRKLRGSHQGWRWCVPIELMGIPLQPRNQPDVNDLRTTCAVISDGT